MDTRSAQLDYICRSQRLLTERLYRGDCSRDGRALIKRAIDRLGAEAQRLVWGLPRKPHYSTGYSLNV